MEEVGSVNPCPYLYPSVFIRSLIFSYRPEMTSRARAAGFGFSLTIPPTEYSLNMSAMM
jgi:hypothetical protein